MKRIEDAKNILNNSIIQEYLGMQNADGNVASITVPRLIPLKFNTVWSSDPALVDVATLDRTK